MKVEKYNGVKLIFSYEITNKATGELRFTGTSSHCFIDKEGKILSMKKTFPQIHQLLAEVIN